MGNKVLVFLGKLFSRTAMAKTMNKVHSQA